MPGEIKKCPVRPIQRELASSERGETTLEQKGDRPPVQVCRRRQRGGKEGPILPWDPLQQVPALSTAGDRERLAPIPRDSPASDANCMRLLDFGNATPAASQEISHCPSLRSGTTAGARLPLQLPVAKKHEQRTV